MNLLEEIKNRQLKNSRKLFETFMTIIVMALITMGAVFDSGIKEVTILRTDAFADVSESVNFKTRQEKIDAFFEESKILVSDNDILTFSMNDKLEDGKVLEIKTGKAITIETDGTKRRTITSKTNVAGALAENGIEIGENDWAIPSFETEITDNLNIVLRRIEKKEEVVTEQYDAPIEQKTDANMFSDQKKIENGMAGEKEVVYSVLYENGAEVYREAISENVIKEAVPTIVTIGTKERPTITRNGNTYTYSKKIIVKATAYDTSPEENGGYSRTALGMKPGFGIVAVDPKVIPLGSKLYIESTDDGVSWTYGYAIAGDTGGAIKGNRIDLCYNSQYECICFGRRNATVYVLE